jgi:hypothetical protein
MIYTTFVLLLGIFIGQEYTMLPTIKDVINACYEQATFTTPTPPTANAHSSILSYFWS